MPALVEISVGKPRRFELSACTTIGRDPDNHISVPDPMVSPKHAEIRSIEGGRFKLIDLGSRRGTFMSSRRVSDAVLSDGDEILIGLTRLRFEDRAVAPVKSPASAASPTSLPAEQRLLLEPEPHFRPAAEITNIDELRRDYEKLRAGAELCRAIGVEHDLTALLERILDTAFKLLAADRGSVILIDPTTRQPTLQMARDRNGKPVEVAISTTIISEVITSKMGVISSDTGIDTRFNRSASISLQGIRSAMCVPMVYREQILGLIHLDSRAAINVFHEKDLELFSTITSQAAVAIKNAILVQRIQTVVAEDWKRLQRVVHHLNCGVLLLDSGRRIVMTNSLVEEHLSLLAKDGRGDVVERLGSYSIDEILSQGGKKLESVIAGPPKRVFSLSAWGSGDSATVGNETVVVTRDVTEEHEQEAKEAQQGRLALIGQLAGGIAHDFNNLLLVILTYAKFLEGSVTDPQMRDDLDQIRRAGMRATELTRQLLAFGRREVVKPQVVDLNRLVADMEKLLRRTLGEHVALKTSFATDLAMVKVDPTKVEQVLLNLAVNARDAMASGGALTIATRNIELDTALALRECLSPGRYAVISVTDTGVGMGPEIVARVFEPFFTTKEKGKGTGLGLATAYGIVQQAEGNILVESAPGRGTTFSVLLPQTTESESESSTGDELALTGGKETILLAEDEQVVRELTARLLRQSGYGVLEAADGTEALALCEQHAGQIQLVLTDVVMPGISGKKLSEVISQRHPSTRVLYMSGYFDDEMALEALLKKDARFLPKPFTRDQLLAQVRAALGTQPQPQPQPQTLKPA